MGSGNKKKGSIDMGIPPYDEKLREAFEWCHRNNIHIAPLAKSATEWSIVIKNQDKTHTSPETYGKTVIWEKIFEYCKYYFNKYNKNE